MGLGAKKLEATRRFVDGRFIVYYKEEKWISIFSSLYEINNHFVK